MRWDYSTSWLPPRNSCRQHTRWRANWPMGHRFLYAWPSVPCTTTRTWICALPSNLKPSRKTSAVKRRTPGKAFGPSSKSAPRASRGVKLLDEKAAGEYKDFLWISWGDLRAVSHKERAEPCKAAAEP